MEKKGILTRDLGYPGSGPEGNSGPGIRLKNKSSDPDPSSKSFEKSFKVFWLIEFRNFRISGTNNIVVTKIIVISMFFPEARAHILLVNGWVLSLSF